MKTIFLFIQLFLTALTAFMLFYGLGKTPPARWDESTNMAVIQSSNYRVIWGDLILNGQPFFEKPPFWYILTKFVTRVRGTDLFSLRLLSAAGGLAVLFLTAVLSWRYISPPAAIITSLYLLGSGQLIIPNAGGYFSSHTFRSADSDSLFILLMLAAFAVLVYSENRKKLFYPVASVLCGISVITKSPLGLLPLVIEYFRSAGKPRLFKRSDIFSLFGPMLVIVSVWFMRMTYVYGFRFLEEYVGYHLILRVLTPLENHNHPSWFYLGIIFNPLINPLPEITFLGLIFSTLIFDNRLIWYASQAAIWILATISLTSTRIAWYALPLYPFLAVVTAGFLDYSLHNIRSLSMRLRGIAVGIIMLLVIRLVFAVAVNILGIISLDY